MQERTDKERAKDIIFYAREYRHFTAKAGNTVLFGLFGVLPFVLVFVLFYSPITRAVCLWAGKVIAGVTGLSVEVSSTAFLPHLGGVHFIIIPGKNPTYTHTLIASVLTVVTIPIVSQTNRNSRPLMIYICMGLYVMLASCIFFLIWPDHFPYVLADYSELYMLQTVALWIILPALFGISLSLMRSRIIERLLAIVVQIFIMLLYNILRYTVYLCLLHWCSNLYMATLYFTFGVLFDFIQMVMIYSIFAKKVSEQYDSLEGRAYWAWS